MSADPAGGWFDELFAGAPVMAILRGLGPQRSLALAEQVWAAGVRALEVPVQQPRDLETLSLLVAHARDRGLTVGAGTVVAPEQVAQVRRAGAAYTVSPGFDGDVVRTSLRAGLPTLPGVATATEIQRCARLGLRWLKAFPAGPLGPDWVRAMAGPFPWLRLVATGGVDLAGAAGFLRAGAGAVALGSSLARDFDAATLARLAGGG